jgi:putative peptidoglycan lipid II flippase
MNVISVVLSLIAASYLEPKWVTVGLAAIFTVHYFIGAGISFLLIKKTWCANTGFKLGCFLS